MDDAVGRQIGNYRLLSELASGAFGSVYLAEHSILTQRKVAVKLMHTYLRSPQERAQFVQEAQFLEQLTHPSILPLIDVGVSENLPYLVTAYAPGGSLRDRLKQQSPFPQEQALRVLEQIGQALQYAHQQHIIHRDLKPENILFTAQGEALLADFGIATMLTTMSMKYVAVIGGTPPYMAPEQFQGQVSKESDQYALACIAYELFTGHIPFEAPDFISMGFKHGTQPPMALTHFNPSVPAFIEQAILKAMAKQRSERYPDVATFIAALTSPPLSQAALPPVLQEEDIPTFLSSHPPTAAHLPQALQEDNIPTFLSSRPPVADNPPRIPEGLKPPSGAIQTSPPSQIATNRPVDQSIISPAQKGALPPSAPAIGVPPSTPLVRPVRRRRITRGRATLLIWMVFLVIVGSVIFFTIHPIGTAQTPVPYWTATTGGQIDSSPAIGNGVVYIGSDDHKLYAFNASGCGQPSCTPLWTASTGNAIFSPAAVNGVVYIGSDDHKLYAFSAAGCGQLSCMPLWTASTGNVIESSPAVASGVVYVGSWDHKLYAFNASGCGQSSCTPLWTASTGDRIYSSPAVANGVVYVGSDDGKLYAFHLPGTGSYAMQHSTPTKAWTMATSSWVLQGFVR